MIKKQRKTIVINLLNFVDDQLAGVGIFTRNLFAVALQRIADEFDVHLLCSRGVEIKNTFRIPDHPRIFLRAFNTKGILKRVIFEQLILPFKLSQADVYWSPTPVMPFLLKVLNRKCRTIISVHDMIPFFVPQKYGRFRSLYVKFISKYGARWADKVITVSENSRRDICSIASVDARKVEIIYNFIPRTSQKISEAHENFFLSISTIEPGKNIEGTLQAFAEARKRPALKDFKFFWIGKLGWGYNAEQIDSMIEGLSLKNHFIITGYVSTAKKEEMLSSCSALIYLSHYEGFGLPVLEGLAHGRPAIVSNSSSLPEVIGNAGIICRSSSASSIADAMEEIVKNRQKYVLEIQHQLLKFDPHLQADKFYNVVKNEITREQ